MEERDAAEPSPGVKQKASRIWLLLLLVTAGVLICTGLFLYQAKQRTIPDVTFQLHDNLSIELADMLYGYHTEFRPGQPFNLNLFLAENLPARLTQFLIKHNVIGPPGFRGSKVGAPGWSAIIDEPHHLNMVFRLKMSGELDQLANTDIQRATGLVDEIINEKKGSVVSRKYRLLLSSPDFRYAETASLNVNMSYRSSGTPGTRGYDVSFHPFGNAHFLWVAPNYRVLDLTLLEGSEKQIQSSSTVRIKNPHYREIAKAAPVQQLPATATQNDVSLVLQRVVGDVAWDILTRKSLSGQNGGQLLSSGTLLKANLESGDEAQTYIKAQVLEGGIPSENWVLSQEKFRYSDGTPIGTGTGLYQIIGTSQESYFSGNNIAVAGGPAIMDLTLRRDRSFPDDEISTLTFALPPVGEAMLVEETINFWNGDVHIKGVANQYRKSAQPYNRLFGPESIVVHATAPSGHGKLKLRTMYLSNDETTVPLKSPGNFGSWGKHDKEAVYEFKSYVNFSTTKVDTTPYTTLTLEFVAPRTLNYRFVVNPEKATIPAEPINKSIWW